MQTERLRRSATNVAKPSTITKTIKPTVFESKEQEKPNKTTKIQRKISRSPTKQKTRRIGARPSDISSLSIIKKSDYARDSINISAELAESVASIAEDKVFFEILKKIAEGCQKETFETSGVSDLVFMDRVKAFEDSLNTTAIRTELPNDTFQLVPSSYMKKLREEVEQLGNERKDNLALVGKMEGEIEEAEGESNLLQSLVKATDKDEAIMKNKIKLLESETISNSEEIAFLTGKLSESRFDQENTMLVIKRMLKGREEILKSLDDTYRVVRNNYEIEKMRGARRNEVDKLMGTVGGLEMELATEKLGCE